MKNVLLLALLACALVAQAAAAGKRVNTTALQMSPALQTSALHTTGLYGGCSASRACSYYRGYDTIGGDYKSYRTTSQTKCCNNCWRDSRCSIWVYKVSSRTCWHQDNSGDLEYRYGYNSGAGYCT
jgi:opacity protein-like surface antigen